MSMNQPGNNGSTPDPVNPLQRQDEETGRQVFFVGKSLIPQELHGEGKVTVPLAKPNQILTLVKVDPVAIEPIVEEIKKSAVDTHADVVALVSSLVVKKPDVASLE